MTFVDPNRLRWGDLFPIKLDGTNGGESPPTFTQQIVNARAPNLPETWTFFLYCNIDRLPIGGVEVDFVFNLVIGVGATPAQFTFTFRFDPAITDVTQPNPYEIDSGTPSGAFPPILFGWKQLTLPAKDIQINCQIIRSGVDVADFICQVGAWVAPRVSIPVPVPERAAHTSEGGGHRWMPAGFEDGEMRYK
jgi:hypothetical protein